MRIEWYKSESTVKPKEVDYESSPTTVYLHRKIKSEEREGVTWFTYEEAKLTPAEYTVYAAEQAREDNLAIMSALTDIYAQIGG
jgi:hypothetical protein